MAIEKSSRNGGDFPATNTGGSLRSLIIQQFFSRPLCGHVLSTLQPLRHKGRFLSFNMHGKNVADLGPFQLACKHEKKVVPMVLN